MNISLTKLSLIVAIATLTTSLVNANEETAKLTTTKTSNIAEQTKFSQLASQFDTDKNGLLSESELMASNNDSLHLAFKQLDVNADSNISEEEFAAFVTSIQEIKNF